MCWLLIYLEAKFRADKPIIKNATQADCSACRLKKNEVTIRNYRRIDLGVLAFILSLTPLTTAYENIVFVSADKTCVISTIDYGIKASAVL